MEKLIADPNILNLPWATLVTLACGYMGYFIAHVGIRDHHKSIDVAFSTLVFGFVAAFSYQIARYAGNGMLSSSLYAALVACLVGAIWRVAGRPLLRWILRVGDIAHADDTPSAWLSLFDVKNIKATQLTVRIKDGTLLHCSDLHMFKDAPNGAFVFGSTGDILLYATHIREPGGEWEAQLDDDAPAGFAITYIPASEVSRVRFQRER